MATKNATTEAEFIERYAKGFGKTPEEIKERGLVAKPCDCDLENCEGWQMVLTRGPKEPKYVD